MPLCYRSFSFVWTPSISTPEMFFPQTVLIWRLWSCKKCLLIAPAASKLLIYVFRWMIDIFFKIHELCGCYLQSFNLWCNSHLFMHFRYLNYLKFLHFSFTTLIIFCVMRTDDRFLFCEFLCENFRLSLLLKQQNLSVCAWRFASIN